MKQGTHILIVALLLCATHIHATPNVSLQKCWDKQVKPLQKHYLTFSFKETENRFYHSFEPWQHTSFKTEGTIVMNADSFLKADSVPGNGKYASRTQFTPTEFLYRNYGDTTLYPMTKSDYEDEVFGTARYSPLCLVNYFYEHRSSVHQENDNEYAVSTLTINKTIVKLFIRISDGLVQKVTLFDDHSLYGLYGDELSTLTYADYTMVDGVPFPETVSIEKINGKLKDEVMLSTPLLAKEVTPLLKKPAGYTFKEEEKPKKPDVSVEKYSDNIHFVHLKHIDARAMIVEFRDFLLVAEAPLTSENGELIIQEAKKIAPAKPIKYFVFGHFHNWYLGGMRAFIHKGAGILCAKDDKEYVDYLANAPHTLHPDSLQLQPRALITQEMKDSTTISDGAFTMKIYSIGKKSGHTKDYLVYYFPKEKLLFEDDLVWIDKEGAIKKANPRQAGLYNAVKELGLDITTVVQSWPVANSGVRSVIPFTDLERSMKVE